MATKTTQMNIRTHPELKRVLTELAHNDNRNLSNYVTDLLIKFLKVRGLL